MVENIIPTEKFQEIISQENLGYTIFDLDLSQPRQNQEFNFHGDLFQVIDLSDGAKFQVCFNNLANRYVDIENFSTINGLYYRFFISNQAQPNKKVKIFCGNRYKYFPVWKIKGDIDNINFTPILNKINDVITSINNLELNLTYDEVVSKLQEVKTAIENLQFNDQNIVNKLNEVKTAINNLELNLTYDEVVSKLDEIKTAINDVNSNLQNIDYKIFALRKNTSLYIYTTTINANQTTQIMGTLSNVYFGITNHSDNLSVNILLNNAQGNFNMRLLPLSSFNVETENPTSFNSISIQNNNSNPVEISYWYRTIY